MYICSHATLTSWESFHCTKDEIWGPSRHCTYLQYRWKEPSTVSICHATQKHISSAVLHAILCRHDTTISGHCTVHIRLHCIMPFRSHLTKVLMQKKATDDSTTIEQKPIAKLDFVPESSICVKISNKSTNQVGKHGVWLHTQIYKIML